MKVDKIVWHRLHSHALVLPVHGWWRGLGFLDLYRVTRAQPELGKLVTRLVELYILLPEHVLPTFVITYRSLGCGLSAHVCQKYKDRDNTRYIVSNIATTPFGLFGEFCTCWNGVETGLGPIYMNRHDNFVKRPQKTRLWPLQIKKN